MNKKTAIAVFLFVLAVPTRIIFAEDNVNAQETLKEQREEAKQKLEEQREQAKQTFETQREEAKQAFEAAREQKKQELEALREKKQRERCENIETRFDTRINRYENNKKMFENVFGNMSARVERLADRLEVKGIDVSKLRNDIETLNGKIDKLFADHDSFMQTLQDAKSLTCDKNGKNKDDLTKIGEGRKVIPALQQDRLDIRDFFQSTIRPDILAIKKQLESLKNSSEDSDDESETTTNGQ